MTRSEVLHGPVRRTFTPQFKKDAVALLREGRSATEVAQSLGIARSLLQRWKEELEKKLSRVPEERDILKKALAYFADDQT
jgi:transposase